MNAKTLLPAGLLLAITFAAFAPALRAGFIWDDNDYVTDNPNLHDADGLTRIWTDPQSNWQYYPLVFTSFWLEFHCWGLHPLGYHLDNILLHAVSAVLLWRLLVQLNLPAAWLAAAIFAIHPVEVESVAWVTERKNVLCGLLYLGAMLVYFGRRHRGWYWIALLLFIGAMLSKTVAATWPIAALVILWWQKRPLGRREIFGLIPFVIIGFFMGLLTTRIEGDQVGAVGKDWELSATDRCLVASRAIWFYFNKAGCPVDLTFIYPKWNLQELRAIHLAIMFASLATLTLLIIRSRQIGRAPAAAVLLFIVTLLPALGFFNVYPMRYSYVADHFQYLAIIAIIVPAAIMLRQWAGKWSLLVIFPLAVLTWWQCGIYHDSVSLWTDTVAKNPSWMPRINLGQALQAQGHMDMAEEQYKAATQANPEEADTWWKLGAFQAAHGRLAEGEANLRRALMDDPTHMGAQHDLQLVLRQERQGQ